MLGNPYTPGAGCTPSVLAGREPVLNAAQIALTRLKEGYPQRSVLYYGLRGVGKTALLNVIEEYADNQGIKYAHIEAMEDRLFMRRLIAYLTQFVRSLSLLEEAKALKERVIRLLASFVVVYKFNDNSVGLSISPDEAISTGVLSDDLTEIFVSLGKLSKECNEAISIFIDEFQFLEKTYVQAIVAAIHRCNQLRLPVLLWCAGLPKAMDVLSKACSYTERMFDFIPIDKLKTDESAFVVTETAEPFGVTYSTDATNEIVETTGGYPYFIQEYCSVIWDNLPDGTQLITHKDVIEAKELFYEKLDSGFFEARFSRCSHSEQVFLTAMNSCKELPCQVSEVAAKCGKTVQQVSPIRATLIDKGIIYAPQRGEVDFTVPLFDQYLQRVIQE